MLEYTIAHYAKNQEIYNSIPSNLLIDSTLSTIYNAQQSTTINDNEEKQLNNLFHHLYDTNNCMTKNFKQQTKADKIRETIAHPIYTNMDEEYEISNDLLKNETFQRSFLNLNIEKFKISHF